ncbi:MAG: hypothetical protein AAGN46_00015 [Acidobacteriota bacterium]
MKLADALASMKALAADRGLAPAARQDQMLAEAARFLKAALGRTGEKSSVAILRHLPEDELLTFVFPPQLASGNVIPVTPDSLAGRVAVAAEPKVFNDVAEQPHKDVFERIPDGEGVTRTIQKMVAAPLQGPGGAVLGIIEVNRTGPSAAAAGPDFTPQDAANLAVCCKAFAPLLHRLWMAAEVVADQPG